MIRRFCSHARVPHPESQYLACMQDILQTGELSTNRTGVNIFKKFGKTLSYPIICDTPSHNNTDWASQKYQLPMMTTKRLFVRGAIAELLWMLRGSTDASILAAQNVNIWNKNSTSEFLQGRGLDYMPGELGPIYGHQWINWGKTWQSRKHQATETAPGINQITQIIESLVQDPTSRRMVLQGWNVADLNKMALPPCHMTYLFDVGGFDQHTQHLNCMVILRSNDMFLGHPFNVVGASLLTIILAQLANMVPNRVDLVINNAHIYETHVGAVQRQIERTPYKYPLISIKNVVPAVPITHPDYANQAYQNICKLDTNDFVIENYECWPAIKAEMVA